MFWIIILEILLPIITTTKLFFFEDIILDYYFKDITKKYFLKYYYLTQLIQEIIQYYTKDVLRYDHSHFFEYYVEQFYQKWYQSVI